MLGYLSQWLLQIAGNLTLLGAASNIIVLETLESRMKETITFVEFHEIWHSYHIRELHYLGNEVVQMQHGNLDVKVDLFRF